MWTHSLRLSYEYKVRWKGKWLEWDYKSQQLQILKAIKYYKYCRVLKYNIPLNCLVYLYITYLFFLLYKAWLPLYNENFVM